MRASVRTRVRGYVWHACVRVCACVYVCFLFVHAPVCALWLSASRDAQEQELVDDGDVVRGLVTC